MRTKLSDLAARTDELSRQVDRLLRAMAAGCPCAEAAAANARAVSDGRGHLEPHPPVREPLAEWLGLCKDMDVEE